MVKKKDVEQLQVFELTEWANKLPGEYRDLLVDPLEDRDMYMRKEWDDSFDMVKPISTMETVLRGLNGDMLFAVLSEQEIEFIVNNQQAMESLLAIMKNYVNGPLNTRVRMTDAMRQVIVGYMHNIVKLYMLRPQLIVNLKRNRPMNNLVELIGSIAGSIRADVHKHDDIVENKSLLDKAKDKLKRED